VKTPIAILTLVAVLVVSFIVFRKTEVGHSDSSSKVESAESTATTTIEPASRPLRAAPAQAAHAKPESPKQPKPTASYAHAAAPVPPEVFDKMVVKPAGALPTPIYLAHERFSREPVDPNWSANVEPQIREYLSAEKTTQLMDVVATECRKTTCEIRAVSRSPELNSQSVLAFQRQQIDMHRQAWWSGYGLADHMSRVAVAPDGRAVMIGYVHTGLER
jgi:hypothetical protein